MANVQEVESYVAYDKDQANTNVLNKAGYNTAKVLTNALNAFANYWGASPVIKDLLSKLGVKTVSRSEVISMINKLTQFAKTKGANALTDLQNRLNTLPPEYSQLAKDAIDRIREALRNRIKKKTAQLDAADSMLNQANNAADEIADGEFSTSAWDKAGRAVDAAKAAATMYEQEI